MNFRLKTGEITGSWRCAIRIKTIGIIAAILGVVTGLAYMGVKQLIKDRQTAMAFHERPIEPVGFGQGQRLPDGRTVTTYNEKDIKEGKESGLAATRPDRLPANPNAAAAANEAAVQRTMRTLDEINRINELNRRLQEQQRNQR